MTTFEAKYMARWQAARRDAAMRLATDGISTEALEAGIIAKLVAVVKELEWGFLDDERGFICPDCQSAQWEEKLHRPGCQLRAALDILDKKGA